MKVLNFLFIILINVSYILAGAVYKVTGISTTLNIRKSGNINSTVVGSLKNNQYIYVTAVSGEWAAFYKGFVNTRYLTKVTNGNKYQTTSNLNFRTGPSTSYNVITTLNKGTSITFFGQDPFITSWAVTNYGYASSEYIKPYTTPVTTTKKNTITITTITVKPTNSSKVKSLVNSLLLFEEGVGPYGVCGAYIDSLGYPSIGYGQLCQSYKVSTIAQANTACASYSKSCTAAVAKQWLADQIDDKTKCINNYTNIRNAYNKASIKRKAIIISMAYQLGCKGLSGFSNTLSHMANGNWNSASVNMMDSLWARQTPNRAKRHAYVIKNDSCGDFCKNYGW